MKFSDCQAATLPVLTTAQMRAVDAKLIAGGMPGIDLMEHAALAVVGATLARWPAASSAACVCGTGNNGGDGFAVARLLKARGWRVTVWLAGPAAKLAGDALTNFQLLENLDIPVVVPGDDGAFPGRADDLAGCDLVIDALCGTGGTGRLTGISGQLAVLINDSRRPVVSIDLPSGVNGDAATVAGPAVKATLTVTLGAAKPGVLLQPAAAQAGVVVVGSLGVDLPLAGDTAPALGWIVGPGDNPVPARAVASHKGCNGRVLIIGGSSGLTGAAQFACRAALAAGTGFVHLATPAPLVPIFATALPDIVTTGLAEGTLGTSPACVDTLLKVAAGYDTVLIGPGWGRSAWSVQTVLQFFRYWHGSLIADADALFALSEDSRAFASHSGELLITPHYGEMARLQRTTVAQVADDPLGHARKIAEFTRALVMLKGARITLTLPGGETLINTSGTPALAVAGTGDLLAGLTAGLRARGCDLLTAAARAAWFLGQAGKAAAARHGETFVTASAVASELPGVLRDSLSGQTQAIPL